MIGRTKSKEQRAKTKDKRQKTTKYTKNLHKEHNNIEHNERFKKTYLTHTPLSFGEGAGVRSKIVNRKLTK